MSHWNTAAHGKIIAYRVRWSITVDHPERRDSTYVPVRPGHKIPMERVIEDHGQAIRFFEEVTGPEWVFGSEYVSHASVTAVRMNWSHADTVRRNRYFSRRPDGRVEEDRRAA